MGEWRESLVAKADFPETQMAMGGAALVRRDLGAATDAFRESVRLDPQLVRAWTMIVRILAATGDLDGARAALDDALAANPSNEMLQSLLGELNGVKLR
jgi:cytochrome c-type biogenesis protein CcmH/NrfG